MNARELATVLAALRLYQQQLEMNGGAPPQDVEDVATNGFEFEPMTTEEIDGLCEGLNMEPAESLARGTENNEQPSQREPAQYLYRPLLRPAGFATMPAGLKWDYVEVPRDIAHLRPNLPVSRHRYGVIACDRELTVKECVHFDVEQVPEERRTDTRAAGDEATLDEGMEEGLGESR